MKQKTISRFISFSLVLGMSIANAGPALALGELPVATPTPVLSVPTPVPTVIVTPEVTIIPTPLPSILPSDTTPPVISGVLEASLLSTDATIAWTTDELAISTLEYGTTMSYGSLATLPATALLVHTGIILNLNPNTTYYYCIHATDISGNASSSCGHSFVTAPSDAVIDANPPVISDISISSLTATSATINWTTEEVANGEIEYGLTPAYDSVASFDPALSTNHQATISNLQPNTLYHYRIRSSDQVSNLAISPDNTFTTELSPNVNLNSGNSNNSVQVSAVISGVEASEITFNSATIVWQTDIPSDSQVEYGDSSLLGQSTTLDSTLSTSHSVTISGLSPSTNYYFRVKSKPIGASVTTTSSNHDFNTLSEPMPEVPPANILSVSTGSITTTSAAIAVTTDIAATTRIEYGITTEYGQTTNADSPASSHTLNLSDLEPATLYHYRVKALNTDGDVTFSEDYTFTTSNPVIPLSPPSAITNLSASMDYGTSATLRWSVSSNTIDAAAEYDIRYSTSLITSSNFDSAQPAQLSPVVYAELYPSGVNRSYEVVGLIQRTQYYFAVRSKYISTAYSKVSNLASVDLSSVPENSTNVQGGQDSEGAGSISSVSSGVGFYGPVSEPSILNAAGDDKEIIFSWRNPQEVSFIRTIIVKKASSYPASPNDGQVVFEGHGETFTDTDLTDGTTYYYTVYAYDHAKNYSSGVKVSLAPRQGITEKVLYKNPEEVFNTPADHFTEVLRRGAKDIEVEHLQEILARDEGLYPEKLITGYFGGLTEQALKRFQKKYNLSQTGITDLPTQQKLNIISRGTVHLEVPEDIILFNRDLSRGSQGEDVAALQRFLTYEGSYTHPIVDGNYGPITVQAVIKFQKKYGVKPSVGYFGYKTRHKIKEISGL